MALGQKELDFLKLLEERIKEFDNMELWEKTSYYLQTFNINIFTIETAYQRKIINIVNEEKNRRAEKMSKELQKFFISLKEKWIMQKDMAKAYFTNEATISKIVTLWSKSWIKFDYIIKLYEKYLIAIN